MNDPHCSGWEEAAFFSLR